MNNRFHPGSEEIEKGVLSSLINDHVQLGIAVQKLAPDCFQVPRHRLLFDALKGLHEQGCRMDVNSLCEKLQATGTLEQIGGVGMIAELVSFVPTPAHGPYYQARMIEKYSQGDLDMPTPDLDS
jgi:replicative DNA helicase